jgi:drug/metabolite transporter (DMT)-like permease
MSSSETNVEKINLINKSENKRVLSIIMLALTAVLWSFGGVLIKLVSWNPIAIAGTRSIIAAITILCVLRKPDLKLTRDKLFGAIAYALTVILFVSANKYTSAANAILLQYSAPIYVAIFGYIVLKEKATFKDWLTISFVIIGMILFFIEDINGGNLFGNILAILSGVAFAFTAIFMRKQKNANPLESILWGNIITAFIGLFFMFSGTMPNTKGWIALILLGTVQLGVSYILYSYAIKEVTALEATIIPVIEPILNPVWVFVILGEIPGTWALIGGSIVLISVTWRCINSIRD